MFNFSKSDVKMALISMGSVLKFIGKKLAMMALALAVAIIVTMICVYLVVNFFWYMLSIIALALVAGWFYIEMATARSTREYDEMQESWSQEKNRPMHEDVK